MKSLGPDGYNAGFYQAYWHIVGSEVNFVVLKFFNESILIVVLITPILYSF